MDYIFTNSSRKNTTILPFDGYIDIDIGKDDDLKVTIPTIKYNASSMIQGGYIYKAGTELGGILNTFSSDTSSGEISFEGRSFRGMLDERFTEPASGDDYLIVNGELNSVISGICGASPFGGLFKVSTTSTGVSVSNFKVGRYYSWLGAINQILGSVNYRINLEVKEEVINNEVSFYVDISAKPITDYSDEVEHSQDGLIDFSISKAPKVPYNYMLLLGSGELKNRIVVKVKINGDALTEVSSIPDASTTRVYCYESTGSESKTSLLEEGQKKIEEINPIDFQKITMKDDMNVWLGDIVGGRDYVTGTKISEPITQIIYKYSNGAETYSYTIGETT